MPNALEVKAVLAGVDVIAAVEETAGLGLMAGCFAGA